MRIYGVGRGIIDYAEEDRALIESALEFGRFTVRLQELFDPYVDFLRSNLDPLTNAYQTGGYPALEAELRRLLATSQFADDADSLVSLLRSYYDAYLAGATEPEDLSSFTRLPDLEEKLRTALELQAAVVTETGVSFSRRRTGCLWAQQSRIWSSSPSTIGPPSARSEAIASRIGISSPAPAR